MKPVPGPIGPRGLTLVAAAGIVGLVLAVHGWSHRGGGAPGSLAGGSAGGSAGGQQPAAGSTASHTAAPTYGPTARSAAPAASPGPLLASQPYAQYAFAVWPGKATSAATAALTGLSVSIHRRAGGITVTAAANGQPATAHWYPAGTQVFVVEATMGDDSGSSDYNLGDDGIVVTDASGRIVS